MTQQEFLTNIAQQLEAVGIPFMVAGSIASSFHGQPRATNDIDLVIDPSAAQLDQFLSRIDKQCYFSSGSAHDALRSRSMFNILMVADGLKADLIVRKNRPFSVEELQRRKIEQLQGQLIPVASPEDVILSKLEWNRITPSERQVRDALNVAVAQRPTLDCAYLRRWATELDVAVALEEVLAAAQQSQPSGG